MLLAAPAYDGGARAKVNFADTGAVPTAPPGLPAGLTPLGPGAFYDEISAGDRVRLAPGARGDGVLSPHEVGLVIRYDGPDHLAPYKVRSPHGGEGWYAAADLLLTTHVEASLIERAQQNTPGSVAAAGTLTYSIPLEPNQRVGLSCKTHNGCVVVSSIAEASPALASGLTPGCIVISVNGMRVARLQDVQEAIDYVRANQTGVATLQVEVDRLRGSHEFGVEVSAEELVMERLGTLYAMREREAVRRNDRFGGKGAPRESSSYYPQQSFYRMPNLAGTFNILADDPSRHSELSFNFDEAYSPSNASRAASRQPSLLGSAAPTPTNASLRSRASAQPFAIGGSERGS